MGGGVKLLASVDISSRAPWNTLNEQHIMACTSTKLMNCTGMQISSRARCPQMEGHWKKNKCLYGVMCIVFYLRV
jgi:hypothetical protein